MKLVHYSTTPGLTAIDPSKQGTGTSSQENKRGVPETKRSYWYKHGTKPEDIVVQGSKAKYHTKLKPHQKIYDIGTDPLGIRTKLLNEASKRTVSPGVVTSEEVIKAIKDSGHHGFENSASSLPNVVALFHPQEVSDKEITHNDDVRKVAEQYAKSKGIKLKHNDHIPFAIDRAKKIAKAYEEMKHDPHNPEVKKAYEALIKETMAQYIAMKKAGVKVTPIQPGQENPYKTSADMHKDVAENKHLHFYPTDQGFGSGKDKPDHPLLQETNEKVNGKKLLANDIFRIVHDYFGHAKEGTSFGPKGEEKAWQEHMQMYSPEAQKALTSETRGQNSWVNFGPKGEQNQADPANTEYAEQKAGIMPEWTREVDKKKVSNYAEGGPIGVVATDMSDEASQPTIKSLTGQPVSPLSGQEVPQENLPQNIPPAVSGQEVPQDLLSHNLSGTEVPPENLPASGTPVPDHALTNEQKEQQLEAYRTPMQKNIAYAEGIAQGATFGLSNKLETGLGLTTNEDIIKRAEANPLVAAGGNATGAIGSLFIPGVGEGWLLAKGAKVLLPIAQEANMWAKVGTMAMRGAVEMMGYAGGDELSDALLGKGHDASAVAMHILGSGAMGLLTGGLSTSVAEGLHALQNRNMGKYLNDFRVGMGLHMSQTAEELEQFYKVCEREIGAVPKGIKHGIEFAKGLNDQLQDQIASAPSKAIGNAVGTGVNWLMGPILGLEAYKHAYNLARKFIDPTAEKLASKIAKPVSDKVMIPIMMNAIKTGEVTGLSQAFNYGTKAARGAHAINKSVNALLKPGANEALHFGVDELQKQKLANYIDNAPSQEQQAKEMVNAPEEQQNFAEGGEVNMTPQQDQGISKLYPNQAIMLAGSRARVQNYLTSLRPSPQSGFLFDNHYEDKAKQRTYDNALHIAIQPLHVLEKIQRGTITPEDVLHLNRMYPEVHDLLSQKITAQLTQHQLDGTRPPYKVRQGLSLFLGTPLDGTFSPQNIVAAQMTYGSQQLPQQQPKKDDKELGKDSSLHQTTSQTAEKDRSARAAK